MILHWLTICALIVVTHGHFRMESDESPQMHTPKFEKINLPAFDPHPRNRPDFSAEVTASVGVTGEIEIQHSSNDEQKNTFGKKKTAMKQMYNFSERVMMGEKELDLFDRMLSRGSVYFEYGMGGSTLFASEHPNLKHITAVDASSEWVEKIRKEEAIGADLRSGRIQLNYVDIGPVGNFSQPLESNPEKEREYSRLIVGARPIPDVVLVDGRYRPACLMMTLLEAMRNNWPRLIIMMHDYERQKYQDVAERVLGKPTELQGSKGRLLSSWELSGETLKKMRVDKMADAERLYKQYEIDPSSFRTNPSSAISTSDTSISNAED